MKDPIIFNYSEIEVEEHSKKYNFFDFDKEIKKKLDVPGKFFLYERVNLSLISYPKLAIFLDCLPCDQTIEVEYLNIKRTHDKRKNNHIESEISYCILWHDDMLVYDVWDSFPDWKQLRRAYEKTWFFKKNKSEIRDIKINQIFNENK